MKKTVLLFVLFLGTLTLGMAQSKENNFLDQPYIEVTGTAMMEVVQDEIYVKIILREKEQRGKTELEQQEKKLFQTLQKVGIDVKKDLAVRNMVGDRYKLKSGAMKLRKEYVLLLHDVNTLDRVFAGLEQMGGVEAEVERVDHSQIEKLRREVKEDAIKVAKEKATGLAAAIGQSIKEAIYIREEHWGGMAAQYMSNVAFDVDRGGVDAGVDFEKIKLQGTVLVRFKLWYK